MNILLLLLTFLHTSFAIEQDKSITIGTFVTIGVYLIVVALICVASVLFMKRTKSGEYAPLTGN